jgi:hypothetical protein
LALRVQIFFPKFENNFEADFSWAQVCGVFTSRSPLEKSVTLALEKSDLIKTTFRPQEKSV